MHRSPVTLLDAPRSFAGAVNPRCPPQAGHPLGVRSNLVRPLLFKQSRSFDECTAVIKSADDVTLVASAVSHEPATVSHWTDDEQTQ